jgi:hypothetical protein
MKALWLILLIPCLAMGQIGRSPFYSASTAAAATGVTLVDSLAYSAAADEYLIGTWIPLSKIPITVSSLTNGMLMVQAMPSVRGGVDSVVLYGGGRIGVLTFLDSLGYTGNNLYNSLWYRLAPPAGSDTVWVYMQNKSNPSHYLTTFSNVNQSTPFGTKVDSMNNGNLATLSLTLASGDIGYIGYHTANNIPIENWVAQGATTTVIRNDAQQRYLVGRSTGSGATTVGWSTASWSESYGILIGVPIKVAP